jgi:hypothetical protein
VLGLIWPLINQDHTELMKQKVQRKLYRILSEDDLFVEIQKLFPGEILQCLVHDHVNNAGRPRVVTNGTKDLSAPGSSTVMRDQSHRSYSILAPGPQTNFWERAEGILQMPRRSTVSSSPAHDNDSILGPEQDELVPDVERQPPLPNFGDGPEASGEPDFRAVSNFRQNAPRIESIIQHFHHHSQQCERMAIRTWKSGSSPFRGASCIPSPQDWAGSLGPNCPLE